MIEHYDAQAAIRAQEQYCNETGQPTFAPKNGWCNWCGRNIYEPYTYRREPLVTTGISVEEAGKRMITGCPHCGHTFVD